MRGALFFFISALCTLVDKASGAAGAGSTRPRASKSRGNGRGSSAADRASRARTIPGRREREDQAVHSDDGRSIGRRYSSEMVIGAAWEDGNDDAEGHQLHAAKERRWEEDDKDENEEEERDDNDECGYDDDDGGGGGEDGASDLGDEEGDFWEETEEDLSKEHRAGAYSRRRGDGGSYSSDNRRRPDPGPSPRRSISGVSYAGAPSNSNRRAHYDGGDAYGGGGSGGSRSRKGAGPSPLSTKKAKATSGVMKSVGKATGKSMKAMVHALQPKSVGLGEILDTWKIEQIIGKPPGRVTKCAATVEFRRDGTVATSFDGRESISDFTFRAHAWPRACTIEFEAKAFQGPWDEEPVWKVYKGSFSRKLLDPKIIMLEGTIYDVTGKMMWKRRVKSGKFTARRRPSRLSRGSGGGGGTRTSPSEKNVRRSYEEEEEHRLPDEEMGSEDGGGAKAGGGSHGGGGGGGKKGKKSRTGGTRSRSSGSSSSSGKKRSRSSKSGSRDEF